MGRNQSRQALIWIRGSATYQAPEAPGPAVFRPNYTISSQNSTISCYPLLPEVAGAGLNKKEDHGKPSDPNLFWCFI